MNRPVPELLSPAGTLDAARAALANGANAVYLGAERFNARDDGAQLTMDELEQACILAHARGARIYLTFNVLMKPAELREALLHLGDCIDRGIDAAGIEFVEGKDGVRYTYDINMNTNYNSEVEAVAGVHGMDAWAALCERLLHA